MPEYCQPTKGEKVGTYNVFHRDGTTNRDVPFEDCPPEVQEMIRRARVREMIRRVRAKR